jgi:hypothetical protein
MGETVRDKKRGRLEGRRNRREERTNRREGKTNRKGEDRENRK